MPVMDVRQMRVAMSHGLVGMRMRMGFGILAALVAMVVVLVVDVKMGVFHLLVTMFMLVGFRQDQVGAEHHQQQGPEKSGRQWIVKKGY